MQLVSTNNFDLEGSEKQRYFVRNEYTYKRIFRSIILFINDYGWEEMKQ